MSKEIPTNGENQAERKSPFLWEIYGISHEDCSAIVSEWMDNTRKLQSAENKVRRARDLEPADARAAYPGWVVTEISPEKDR